MTKAQLLQDLMVERFTHLPQSNEICEGPTSEYIRQQRHDDLEAAHILACFPPVQSPDSGLLVPVLVEHPQLAIRS